MIRSLGGKRRQKAFFERKKGKNSFGALLTLLLLTLGLTTACSTALTKDKGEAYSYKLQAYAPVSKESIHGGLMLEKPVLGVGLDSDRIALLREKVHFDYYAESRWAGPLGAMVQGTLIESLEKSNLFSFVVSQNADVPTAFVLLTDVRDFQAVYTAEDTPPQLKIRLGFKVVDRDTGEVTRRFELSKTAQAHENRISVIAQDFDDLFKAVQYDLARKLKSL